MLNGRLVVFGITGFSDLPTGLAEQFLKSPIGYDMVSIFKSIVDDMDGHLFNTDKPGSWKIITIRHVTRCKT